MSNRKGLSVDLSHDSRRVILTEWSSPGGLSRLFTCQSLQQFLQGSKFTGCLFEALFRLQLQVALKRTVGLRRQIGCTDIRNYVYA